MRESENLDNLDYLHNEQFEKIVLGSMLLFPSKAEKGLSILSPDHFFNGDNQQTFRAMQKLYEENMVINETEVGNRIKWNPKYISELITSSETNSNFDSACGILINFLKLRNYHNIILQAGDVIKSGCPFSEKEQSFERLGIYAADQSENIKYRTMSEVIKSSNEMSKNILLGKQAGIKTGYRELDNIIDWMDKGNLVIIAAASSIGKTAFGLSIVDNVSRAGLPCAVHSFEMKDETLVNRLEGAKTGIRIRKIKRWDFEIEDGKILKTCQDEMAKQPIYFDNSGVSNIDRITTNIKIAVRKYGIQLVMIDHLLYLSGDDRHGKEKEVSGITKKLKALAKKLDIVILLLTQLNRDYSHRAEDKKRPILTDLKESGAIEQDSDQVIMLYRDDYYNPNSDKKGIMEVLVRKNRDDTIGECEYKFVPDICRFEEILTHGEALKEDNKMQHKSNLVKYYNETEKEGEYDF